MKLPGSQGGSSRRPGQARSQGTLGTASKCLEGDLGGDSSGTPEGAHSPPCPRGPRLALVALCWCPVITFPPGWLQGSLPNFLCRGCQVLAHCCIVREVRKTVRSLQGLFPSSVSWPNLQENQQRAAGKALSLCLPLSLSLPVRKEPILSQFLPATGVYGKQLSISHGASEIGNGGGHCWKGESTCPPDTSHLGRGLFFLQVDPLP